MNIILSFCIPTFNRASFLRETIESILSQSVDGIEIVISDNASTDNTEEVVREYQKDFKNITYFRWYKNMGADKNFLKAVSLARGDYCWLMGSDDALRHCTITRVIKELHEELDVYLCNRIECDVQLRPIRKRLWLLEEVNDSIYNLGRENDFIDYMKKATSIGALFSYISTIIFKRKKWLQVEFNNDFIGTAYSHVFMLLSFIAKECRLKYIKEPLVLCRGDNDSFSSKSFAKRVILDLEGYKKLADAFFVNNSSLYRHFIEVLNSEFDNLYFNNIFSLLKIKAFSDKNDWKDLIKLSNSILGKRLDTIIVDKIPTNKKIIAKLIKIKRKMELKKAGDKILC